MAVRVVTEAVVRGRGGGGEGGREGGREGEVRGGEWLCGWSLKL